MSKGDSRMKIIWAVIGVIALIATMFIGVNTLMCTPPCI